MKSEELIGQVRTKLRRERLLNFVFALLAPMLVLATSIALLALGAVNRVLAFVLLGLGVAASIYVLRQTYGWLQRVTDAEAGTILDRMLSAKSRFLTIATAQARRSTDSIQVPADVLSAVIRQGDSLSEGFDADSALRFTFHPLSKRGALMSPILLGLLLFILLHSSSRTAESRPDIIAGRERALELRELIDNLAELPPSLESELETLAAVLESDGLMSEAADEQLASALDAVRKLELEQKTEPPPAEQPPPPAPPEEPKEEKQTKQDAKQPEENKQQQDAQSKSDSKSPEGEKQEEGEDGGNEGEGKGKSGASGGKEQGEGEGAEQGEKSEQGQSSREAGEAGEKSQAGDQGTSTEPKGGDEGNEGEKQTEQGKDQGDGKQAGEKPGGDGTKSAGKSTQGGEQKAGEPNDGASEGKDELAQVRSKLESIEAEQQKQAQQEGDARGDQGKAQEQKGQEKKNGTSGSDRGEKEAKEQSMDEAPGDQDGKRSEKTSQSSAPEDSSGSVEDGEEQDGSEQSDPGNIKRPEKLPEPSDRATRFGPFEGGTEGELDLSKRNLERMEIPPEEKLMIRGSGTSEDKLYRNLSPARAKTALGPVDFKKPEADLSKSKQSIPVEYQDVIR